MRVTRIPETGQRFVPLLLPLVMVLVLVVLEWGGGDAFTSHEVRFTDPSENGLAIMPASCASSPAYFHTHLGSTTDPTGYGLLSATGQTEYGATHLGISLCVTNASGASYFIPAKTAEEMQAFYNATIPGIQSWP